MPKKKIALVFICLNENYWPYAKNVIEDCRKNFLTNHQVDYFLWSDMPEGNEHGCTVIPTEPATWPLPTLMRYHLFLQEEEKLKEYDYIFYCDVDMRVVAPVTDEILGEGLTAAQHPMYAFDRKFMAPIEPNPNSTAYINTPRYYYAGGFQGGKAADFIEAMKVMRKNVDKDFMNNYQAIWNDESHWNKYLSEYKGHLLVLSPSYIYPDSLINEYYIPIWGRNYKPIIITLTKPFSLTKEGGAALKETIERFKTL